MPASTLEASTQPSKIRKMTDAMTVEQRDWLAKLDACASVDGFDLDAFEKLPPSPFPPPSWINKHSAVIGNSFGRQLLIYCNPATRMNIEISRVVIPMSLLGVNSIEDLEEWQMYWEEPHIGAKKEVTQARGALSIERHVRTNVTRKTFLSWRQENPRSFITERELVYWIRMGVLWLRDQAAPSSAGESATTDQSKPSKRIA
jgi:hypothetical protein